jgi:putative sterol carrier protein
LNLNCAVTGNQSCKLTSTFVRKRRKKEVDYVIRRFNLFSAQLNKPQGWIFAETPYSAISKFNWLLMKNKKLSVLLTFIALALVSPCQAQQPSRHQNSTPQEALDKRQDAFQADKAKGVHASYQWELSGPNGGEWWVSVNDGTYKMGRGKIDNPNVTFAASDEDWVAMSNKTLKVQWAYLTGRLKIQGSHSLVKKLDGIFP